MQWLKCFHQVVCTDYVPWIAFEFSLSNLSALQLEACRNLVPSCPNYNVQEEKNQASTCVRCLHTMNASVGILRANAQCKKRVPFQHELQNMPAYFLRIITVSSVHY